MTGRSGPHGWERQVERVRRTLREWRGSGMDEKSILLSKTQADYLYMLVSMVHADDPDAPGVRAKLDVIRAQWDAEDAADEAAQSGG